MSDSEREADAKARMFEWLSNMPDELFYVWHWGDDFGGYVLESVRDEGRRKGWASDPPTAEQDARGYRKHRETVYDRDGRRCVSCGSQDDLTIDHVVPRSNGGSDHIENLQTLCRSCNCRKGAR